MAAYCVMSREYLGQVNEDVGLLELQVSDALRERQQSALECSTTATVDAFGIESHTSGVSGVPVRSFGIHLRDLASVDVFDCNSLHGQGVIAGLIPKERSLNSMHACGVCDLLKLEALGHLKRWFSLSPCGCWRAGEVA